MAETQQNQPKSKLLSAQHTLLTAEDLWKQPDDGYRYELVKGVIRRMPPAGFEHGIREVYRSPEDMTVLHGDDILEGSDVIEGFQCYVQDLFV